jgi:amino acid adenylation domain-containing protein
LWLLNKKNPRDLSYNIPVAFLIEGALDVAALNQSLRAIINRHQTLRTRFVSTERGDAAQAIVPEGDFCLSVIAATESDIPRYVKEVVQHVFDLSSGPVIIGKLLGLEPQKHLLLLNVHHISADGWSIEGILFSELQKTYAAFCRNESPVLSPLPIQYRDFACWQRKQDMSVDLLYWQNSLADYEDSLELPTDFLRHPHSGRSSETFVHHYEQAFSRELDQFAQSHGCTLFMCLLAGFGLVVNRYTGKDDLCIGTTTSGRTLPELEGLIGFFINILPLRIQVNEELSISEYLNAVRKVALSGFDHQMVPFERTLYSMGLDRNGKPNALVPLVLRHQNFPHTRMDTELPGGVKFSPFSGCEEERVVSGDNAVARCELELSYTGDRDELKVEVMYASDLYRRETVERILSQVETVLKQMFTDDRRRISELTVLSEQDVQRLTVTYNRSPIAPLSSMTFVERWDAQALLTPNAIACYDHEGEWSYSQISVQANRLSYALIECGVTQGDVVGVCLERGASLLVSFLAIWKAGAAYVPLDPSYPDTYLRQIIDDATPKKTICTATHRAKLGLPNADCIVFETQLPLLGQFPDSAPVIEHRHSDLAYLMYTSGSTGIPKGVRVPHRQLVNWLGNLERNWPFARGEVVAQKTTMAFAVSVKEQWAGLLNGCALAYFDNKTVQDVGEFVAALAKYRISRLNLVPSHLEAVLTYLQKEGTSLPSLTLCITAGEPLTAELVMKFRSQLPHTKLLNNYGCTELNDIAYYDTTAYDGTQGFVPIGKPIQNTQLYVLDRRGRLVPEGVAGELHVASSSMSEGYQNLESTTRERYVKNCFSSDPGSVLYNTGDVVKYLPDGNVEFLGRWDAQVKVRGFRVDVRHVEKVLGEFPGMGQRAVVGDGSQLVAYYVPRDGHQIDVGKMRSFLRAHLPPYMVPSAFVAMMAMPRLPNGKMDRRSLKPSAGRLQHSDVYEAPKHGVEATVATIWSEVLEFPEEEIGRHTNFFEIGGHSLSATRVVARIKERLKLEIGLSQVFESPRLDELSRLIEDVQKVGLPDDDKPYCISAEDNSRESQRRSVRGLLEDKVILVTGASRGIGSATVRLLASQGAKIALNYVQSEARANTVKDLIEQEGGTAETFQANVTDAVQVNQLVNRVRARFGQIDVLVHNAAIGFKIRPFVEYEWGDFERKLNDELKSMFNLCQAVVPEMIERKNGSIVAVSSTMSKLAQHGYCAHSSAKAALDAFVRALAIELGPDGVRINTVAPGLTLTDATANMPHQIKDAAAAKCPLRRNGIPRDVAGAVLFLASDLSQFMTGTYLPVDGGYTML